MPKISIVMPTYNQSKFIHQAVESILNQTFKDFELVIVDDGSKDNTESILSNYLKDPRIIYIKKDNGGTGSALNEGFEGTRGVYETWFASDNILFPNALETLNNFLDNSSNIDYVYANCDIHVMDEGGLKELQIKNIKEEVDQTWRPEVLLHHYFLGIMWLWRKELRLEPCEDYDSVLRMVDAGGRFAFLDINLGWFRRHTENMTHKIMKDNSNKFKDPHFYSKLVQNKSRTRRGLPLI